MKKSKNNFTKKMSLVLALVLFMEMILPGFDSFMQMYAVAEKVEDNKLDITDFTGTESKFNFPVDSTYGTKANIVGKELVLTPSKANQFGTAMTKEPLLLPVDKSFSTKFSFSISDMGKYSQWVQRGGGDAMFYILQSEPSTPAWSDKKRDGTENETSDGDKGVYITNGLMLEFRTYSIKQPQLAGSLGTIPNFIRVWSGNKLIKEIEFKEGYFDSSNQINSNNVWLDYDGVEKKLSLYLKQDNDTKPAVPIWSGVTDLSNALTSNNLYGSMSAWQGHAYEKHSILSWGIETPSKKSTALSDAKALLEIGFQAKDSASNVKKDLQLPTSNTAGDKNVNIAWSTSDPSVITEDGKITRPIGVDKQVTLIATLSDGSETVTKSFEVTVKKALEDSNQVAIFNQVGPTKIFESQATKSLTIIGKGFESTEDDFKFILKKRGAQTGTEIPNNKVVINSDKEIRTELPKDIEVGFYDLIVEQKSKQIKTFNNAFEVTSNKKYKSRKYSEIIYNPKKLTTKEVNKVLFKGPFEENNGKYLLSDTKEIVTINEFLKFKGSQLSVDPSGVVTGNGRLYVNGRAKNGINTTYTLHEGGFKINDNLEITLVESGTYDFLKLNMPVGIKTMTFTTTGLKAKGSINSKLKLGITDVSSSSQIDNLEISPNGIHLQKEVTMPGTLDLGLLKASELLVNIDTKQDKYGFSASAGIPYLGNGFELELGLVRGKLDTIKFAVDQDIPIGTTGTKLTQLGGGMKGLAKGSKLPLTFSMLGGLSDTVTPEILDRNMINANNLDLGLSRSHVELSGKLAIYTLNVADVEANVVFNPIGYPGFNKAGFKLDARLDILGIVLGQFNVQYFEGESFKGYLKARVIVPRQIPLVGGQTLSKTTLGVDNTKVRGSLSVIGVGFVTSYTFKDKKVNFKVDAMATLKNVGKAVVGAAKFVVKKVKKVFKSIGKSIGNFFKKGFKKKVTKITKAIKKGAKKFFKKFKFWSSPVYFANGDSMNPENDFALIEALQGSTEEVDVVQITAEDTERMLIEITDVSNKDIIHVQLVESEEIYKLDFDSLSDDWNAVYREEEQKVYFFVDLEKGKSIDIASEDNSIQSDNVESYGINSSYTMQEIINEYIVNGQEIPFTLEKVLSMGLVVKHTTDKVEVIRPNGENYILDFDSSSANWNAIYSEDKQEVTIKVPNAEVGDWNVFIPGDNEQSDVDFFDVNADTPMSEDLINSHKVLTFELDSEEQVYIKVKNSSKDAKLVQPNGSQYILNFDSNSDNFNAFFDESTEVLHLLVNVEQTGEWQIDNDELDNEDDVEFYTLETSIANLKPLFANSDYTEETYFQIDKPGRYLFEITNGDTKADVIRPDKSTVEKITDEKDLNQNAIYQEEQKRMYIKVDVDLNQLGHYTVQTKQPTEITVTQVNPLPEITSLTATKDEAELNTYDFAWNIENPREGSEISLMLTTSSEELVGIKLKDNLNSSDTAKVTIPRSVMSGEYYVVLETNHEDIGPKFKVSDTPITVSWPDAPSAPKDLSIVSTANAQVTLGFKDDDFNSKSFYRVLQKKDGKIDYFGSNQETEVNKDSENQQINIDGLKTNETYTFVIIGGINDENKPGVSLPSQEIEVYLPEPTPPEVTIDIEIKEGSKQKTFTELIDDTWEDITTLINQNEASVSINVNEESTIEVYVNDELKNTVKGTKLKYDMNNLDNRDYFIDVLVKNEKGDQNRAFRTLYVDTEAPMLQMNNEQFSVVDKEEELAISGQTDMGAVLSIDGEEVTTDDNGNFSYDYKNKGRNGKVEVDIISTDTVGNTTEHTIELLLESDIPNELDSIQSVTVTPAQSTIVQGESAQLKVEVKSTGQASKTVNWSSSDNNNKVKVDGEGKVTVARDAKPGTYNITATSLFDASKKGTVTITVKARSNGGGSTPGSNEDTSTIIVVPSKPTDTKDKPTETIITVKTDKENVTVLPKTIRDAISKAKEEAKKNNTQENGISVEINIESKNNNSNGLSANLPKLTVDELSKEEVKEFKVSSDVATISLDLETIKTIQKEINTDVNLSAKKVDNRILSQESKLVVGNRPVFDITITGTNGTKVNNFGEGKVKVSIPYTLAEGEKQENIVVYYISNDGKVKQMTDSVYNEKTKTVKFVTDHFSRFAVGYNIKEFELQKNVELDKVWTIKFNKIVDEASVNENSIYIQDEAGNKVSLDRKVEDNKVILTPKDNYKPATKYTIHVTDGVESNKKILKPYILKSFETVK